MPNSWLVAVNIGSIIKGFSLPCSLSSPRSANACICNVPVAALSPPATWIHCQPLVHDKALIWRQASKSAKVGIRKKWPPTTSSRLSHSHYGHPQLQSKAWLWKQRPFIWLPCALPLCNLPMSSSTVTVLRLEFVTTPQTWINKAELGPNETHMWSMPSF